MLRRWAGPIVVVLILGGVIAVLALNLNLKGRNPADSTANPLVPSRAEGDRQPPRQPASVVQQPAGFREYPIGDEVEKNPMLIKAVWLPPIQMEGMDDPASSSLIHLEADVHATEGNPNGFAKDEFVPYLIVHYTITPADGKPTDAVKADRRQDDADGRTRRPALRGHHRSPAGRPLQAHLRDSSRRRPAGWAATSIRRPESPPGGNRSRFRLTGSSRRRRAEK